MEKFKNIRSIPVHMPILNIDTDMIIPKQFLKTIKRTGLGKNLFYEMRYDEKGNLIKDFVLNKKPFSESKILLAGKNFGCGSSREHAPWALTDFGIKCVISPSFADIFYSNCFKNGILPIVLDEKIIQELAEYSKRETEIEIKIETQEIIYGNKAANFYLDSFKKKCLIEGIDDIDLSLEKISNIQDYENKIKNTKPWLTNND
jgi:3-isopropylmalate/(R)-2-methylmalate dehydratase small subunit